MGSNELFCLQILSTLLMQGGPDNLCHKLYGAAFMLLAILKEKK